MSHVADLVAKLLAKGRDPSVTEEEADAFMAKAQSLMAQHNLSMATLEAAGQGPERRVKEERRQSLMYQWKRDLLSRIAKVNYCLLLIKTEYTASGQPLAKGYELIGRQSNVIACKQLFEYLTLAVERALVQEVGTNPKDRYNRWSHTFRLGCSERLSSRLEERHASYLEKQAREAREANARAKHPGSTGTALVIVMTDFARQEEDENNDIRMGWPIGRTAANRATNEATWKARMEEVGRRQKELMGQGYSKDMALYMAVGYTEEEARRRCDKENKPETPSEARKRAERDRRDQERREARQQRANDHKYSEGYRAGYRKAEHINLDDQVEGSSAVRLER
jgi:hypothetical protein